jgi:Kef-type K+ transport system membrane component KefB
LFIGTALSVTAFPVLARIVHDTGLRDTRLGALAMLCAAIADVLAWAALAVVLAMVRAQGPNGMLRTLGLTAALSVVCVFGLRPLIRVLTTRYAGTALPRAVRLMVVIGLIIGLATATDRIGVHAIFGGFLAGLVLPRGNSLFGEAADQITTMNRALLVPVFFASIGMQADIRLAVSHPAVLAGGALLCAAAVAGKLGSAAPVAWAGGMPGRSALGLGVLMNARGVTEIVVLSVGLSAGVINAAAFTVLVVMALLTTCMATPALRFLGLARRSLAGGQ